MPQLSLSPLPVCCLIQTCESNRDRHCGCVPPSFLPPGTSYRRPSPLLAANVLIFLRIHWFLACPYCQADLEIDSPLEHIFISWRTCPDCGSEFLIEDGKAIRSPN